MVDPKIRIGRELPPEGCDRGETDCGPVPVPGQDDVGAGEGDGTGYGDGCGSGYGEGDGTGYGDGDGCGDGCGTGYGTGYG